MDYQLVLKFRRASLPDESIMATIESGLREALDGVAEVDGYDTTTREFNLFILTADPRPTFRRAKPVLEQAGVLERMSAAYRLSGGAQFTSVWPLRTTRRFSLP